MDMLLPFLKCLMSIPNVCVMDIVVHECVCVKRGEGGRGREREEGREKGGREVW